MIRVSLLLCLAISSNTLAQNSTATYADDVKSIDAIVDAYYDVISGSSTDPWQHERDAYLHSPKAIITRIGDEGSADTHSLAEEYIPYLLVPKEDVYEVELYREVSDYGQIAQVWSTYELRSAPDTPSDVRGVNSIQLHFDQGRWWITSWLTQYESEEHPIPDQLLQAEGQ